MGPPPLSGLFQLPIPRGVDLLLPPGVHIGRRYEADGAVESHRVVVVHILLDQVSRIPWRQRRSGPDTLSFERFVPTLDLSVRLQIVRRRLGAPP
jgi:hypothetical protein